MSMFAIGSLLFLLSAETNPLLTLDHALSVPKLPFEATTFEQDDLVEFMTGHLPDFELTFTEACDRLIEDETAPFELRAWAFRMKLRILPGRQAIEAGRAWLDRYGDVDPHAIVVRYLVALNSSFSNRAGEHFLPYEELRAVYEDLFNNHSPANLLVIQAHQDYENALNERRMMISRCHKESVEQAGQAVEAMRLLIGSHDWTDDQRKSFNDRLARLVEHYAKRLQEEGPRSEYNIEKEEIERQRTEMKLYNERSELLREYLIKNGILGPDEINRSILDQNKYRYDPAFLEVWRKKQLEREAEE